MSRYKTLVYGGIALGVGAFLIGGEAAEQDEPIVQGQDLDAVCDDVRRLAENLTAMPSTREGNEWHEYAIQLADSHRAIGAHFGSSDPAGAFNRVANVLEKDLAQGETPPLPAETVSDVIVVVKVAASLCGEDGERLAAAYDQVIFNSAPHKTRQVGEVLNEASSRNGDAPSAHLELGPEDINRLVGRAGVDLDTTKVVTVALTPANRAVVTGTTAPDRRRPADRTAEGVTGHLPAARAVADIGGEGGRQ